MNTHRCLRLVLRIACLIGLLTALYGTPALCQSQKPRLVVEPAGDYFVTSVCFSPDGKTLASGSHEYGGHAGIKLWNTATGEYLRTLPGNNGGVRSVAFSPDGKTLASGETPLGISLSDVMTGKKLDYLNGNSNTVSSVCFSSDGKTIAGGSFDKTIKLWDTTTKKVVRTLTGHTDYVTSVAISPDGKILASGSRDKTVKLWDTTTGKEMRTLSGHTDGVMSVAFSPDGKLLASGSHDKTIKFWDAATGSLLHTVTGNAGDVNAVAFSPNGKTLVSGSGGFEIKKDGSTEWKGAEIGTTLMLWDVATGKMLRTLGGDHNVGIDSVTFNPDGRIVASGSTGGTVTLWSAATGATLHTLTGHTNPVSFASFSPDGRNINCVTPKYWQNHGWYDSLKRWDLMTGQLLPSLQGDIQGDDSIALSPNGQMIAGSLDGVTKLWDPATGKMLRTLNGKADGTGGMSFSPNGKLLATSRKEGPVQFWDTATGNPLRPLVGYKPALHKDYGDGEAISRVHFSPDGKLIAILNGSIQSPITKQKVPTTKLWDAATGQLKNILIDATTQVGHSSGEKTINFSPDGKTLVSCNHDSVVELWDVTTGTLRHTLTVKGEHWDYGPLSFSPDSKTIAMGMELDMQTFESPQNPHVALWDVETGRLLHTLASESPSSALAFSSDGKILASGELGGNIEVWDMAADQLLHTLTFDSGLDLNVVYSLSLSPDGSSLISRSDDQTVRVWSTKTGNLLATLYNFSEGGWATVTPDGRFDGNDSGLQNLHYVFGLEPIDLAQLKSRYYEPGLFAKLLGFNKESLRNISAFDHVDLYPDVKAPDAVPADGKLPLSLTNRGGGIGRVQVFVNGKELSADARGPKPDPQAKTAEVTVDVSHAPGLVPGQPNTVMVVTWNAEGYLSSRGVECVYTPPGTTDTARPELWAIVGGISDYAGPGLHLTYPAKDAADFAHALTLAAGNLFGVDKVHLTLLDSDHATGAISPTKAGLQQAFAEARKAKPGDIFVVYLAGHGVALPGSATNDQNDLYCYLTADATTGDPAALSHDLTLRQATTVSSEELTDWVKQVPAQKQVMVLDTCAAGAAAALLTAKRDVPSDQIRAIERLKDRTGFYVLMGCAADAASYETSRYRQGLLTYSLLKGMKGASLRDGQYVDVGSLFNYAVDEVPQLAQNIGGVQRPFVAAPSAGSFDMGELSAADRQAIPLAVPRPMVLRPELVPLTDDLNLEALLVARLREENAADTRSGASGPGLAFVDATDFPGALQVRGAYTTDGDQVSVTLKLRRDGMDLKTLHLTGTRTDLPGLVGKLSTAITGATETP